MPAVLLWSTVASAFKIALRNLSVVEVLAYASISSALTLWVALMVQGKLALLRQQRRRDWMLSAALGLLNPFSYYLVLFKAYEMLPAQEAQPLNYTWPVVLSLLSVPLLKQWLSRRALLGLLVSFTGVWVISTRGDLTSLRFTNPVGCSLAIGSSLIWALFWIFNLRDARDPTVKLVMSFSFGILYMIPLLAWKWKAGFSAPSGAQLASAVYIGLFEMGLTFLLWLKALEHAENSAAVSHLAYFSPFLSLIFIRLIVGEEIMFSSIVGLVLIVGGILTQSAFRKSR